MKKRNIFILLLIPILLIVSISLLFNDGPSIKSIRSEKQLLDIYRGRGYGTSIFDRIKFLPFSLFLEPQVRYYSTKNGMTSFDIEDAEIKDYATGVDVAPSGKDYSKTNVQVEGVDEADIVKTDGDYIYSISDSKVLITDVNDPKNIKVVAEISNGIPNDLLLHDDKLIVILTDSNYSYYNNNTIVRIYDISNKKSPVQVKSFELKSNYYTARSIGDKLYIFSNGYLREKNNKIDRTYKENNKTKEIELKSIKYFDEVRTNKLGLIAEVDLDNINKDIKLSSYLFDFDDAYVSENNIYLFEYVFYSGDEIKVKDLFTLKGVFGLFTDFGYDYYDSTRIYKFKFDKNDGVVYSCNTEVRGEVINQYSFDEKDGNLRVALDSDDGTRVVVLDDKLKLLGETESVAEGEKMYASRFIGDKAYLVTYQNTDPLFVIDLSDVKNPTVLGELKIPGYSTYLHPYDDTHLIGIGMETEERVVRDSYGRVTSTSVSIVGMKMSLFDVSDYNNPKQLASTVIGDRRTASAILTNPKALLFSKEKNLIAIPVNNYVEDFVSTSGDTYEEQIDEYVGRSNNYISEGYLVYNIDLKDGFKLKGTITHENGTGKHYYYTKLLRGLYIEDNLFTVSENEIKVNRLEDLEQIASIKLKKEGE